MRFIKDRAFVLRRINFGDSDRYITLFSENNGKIEVVAKGVRKITSRRSASCELLNLIEFQAVKTPKSLILTEVKLLNSFEHLKSELTNIKKVFIMCELLEAVLPQAVGHPEIFDLVQRAADKIHVDEKNMAYFQAKLLSELGFWDHSKSFRDDAHLQHYIEQVIERKLKSSSAFNNYPSK